MRNITSSCRLWVPGVLSLVLLFAWAAKTKAVKAQQQSVLGQQPSQNPPHTDPISGTEPNTDANDPFKASMQARQARILRDDRHKRLEADTTRLVQLSTELQSEVDKAGKDDLSLAVIRKADEIEKLAHDVKERMKN